MTEEEQYLDGKIAALESALEALIRNRLLYTGQIRFANHLSTLSIEQPIPSVSFQKGFSDTLTHLSLKLLGDNKV